MPKLLDQVRRLSRLRHYSRRTAQAYIFWIKRFIHFHGLRHPSELGREEVSLFLSHLASERHVSASTQNQALAALLFLYRDVLSVEHTIAEVASLFDVGTAFVNKLLRLHRTGSDLAPRPHGGGYPPRLLPRHEKLLRSQVRRQKDSTLEELCAHLEEQAGLAVSISTVSRALIRLDLGRK